MTYKTLDNKELQEGEDCFIALQCLTGEHNISPNPRAAVYMDETAKHNGWDFTLKRKMKVDCDDCGCEVIGVWKNNPGKADK